MTKYSTVEFILIIDNENKFISKPKTRSMMNSGIKGIS